jgi:hypothetical protein
MLRRRVVLGVVVVLCACGGGGSARPGGAGGGDGGAGSGDGGQGDAASGGDASAGDGASGDAGGSQEAGVAPIAGLRAFYTDLTSGPNTGGQGGKGAFVTVYGNGFGAARGTSTVTVGGGAADNYPAWSNTKITFQLGAAAASGNVVVNVASKGASNGLPFTVRGGSIYFVSSHASSDSNPGTYASPWATIPKAKNSLQPGDVAYIGTSAGDAVSQTTVDASSSYDCALGMSVNDGTNAGTAAMPKALVVYPGATATVGVESGIERGILTPAITGTFDYWTIAGFTLRGAVEAIDLEGTPTGWRVIGNDISCPNGTGLSGCVTGGPTNIVFYGNVVHDAAANVTTITKYYHGVYWGSSHIDMGWNTVRDGKTCRAIQFHDTGGPNEFDLHVHDNVIHGTVCDGINFATVDPSQGTVEAYDNLIYDVGQGPDPADGAASYAGIYVPGETEAGSPGSGTVQVFDNTIYDCGSWTQNSGAGALSNGGGNPSLTMNAVNNLVAAASAQEAYLAKDSAASLVGGNGNLFFGAGSAPAGFTASVTGDPKLVAPATFDFHLGPGSAAIGAGVATSAITDLDGNPRPSTGPFDIGAYVHTP